MTVVHATKQQQHPRPLRLFIPFAIILTFFPFLLHRFSFFPPYPSPRSLFALRANHASKVIGFVPPLRQPSSTSSYSQNVKTGLKRKRTVAACQPPPYVTLQKPSNDLPSSIRAYVRTHATTRAKLASGPSIADTPPILVWRCPGDRNSRCGGLGDRLRGMRFAFLLALMTNRTFMIQVPDDPFPLRAALSPAVIDWTLPPSLLPRLPKISETSFSTGSAAHLQWANRVNVRKVPIPRARRAFSSSRSEEEATGDVSESSDENDGAEKDQTLDLGRDNMSTAFEELPAILSIAVHCAHDCVPMVLSNRRGLPADVRGAIDVLGAKWYDKSSGGGHERLYDGAMRFARLSSSILFRPSRTVESRVKALGFPSETGPYVGVHLRTGGDVSESRLPRFRMFWRRGAAPQLAKAVSSCAKNVANEEGARRAMFLATDSIHFRDVVAKTAVRDGWTVRTAHGKAMHVAKRAKRGSKEGEHKKCERFLSVFAELTVLGRARVIVSTISGFSKTAFMMGSARRREFYVEGEHGGRCVSDAHGY